MLDSISSNENTTNNIANLGSESGYVYMAIHEMMPGMVKIGCTSQEAEQRVEELGSNTCVPRKFKLFKKYKTKTPFKLESEIHKVLKDYRYSKEFFEISPKIACKFIDKHLENTENEIVIDELTDQEAIYRVESVKDIGKLIKDSRKELKLRQAEVASMAGTGIRFVREIESGKNTIQTNKLIDVLESLDMDICIKVNQNNPERE